MTAGSVQRQRQRHRSPSLCPRPAPPRSHARPPVRVRLTVVPLIEPLVDPRGDALDLREARVDVLQALGGGNEVEEENTFRQHPV